jgi:FAD/FMN-containing dehydrogenase
VRIDWESLNRSLAGAVVLEGSTAYDQMAPAFNARFKDVLPQAIVQCAAPEDVAETLSFLRRHELEHAVRSGGHCFGGRSSTPGVVIDVTPMRSVTVSGDVAIVGAGSRLGDVYDALHDYGATIPGGTCPAVGVAGLALGGGLGILGRTYGVTADRLVGVEIVLADGRILECDERHDQDLFWALRGAGTGNFGVVTSLLFRSVPVPDVTNCHLTWPYSDASAVIEAWQERAPTAPDGLAASLKVTASGEVDEPPSVDVYAAYLGSEAEAAELLDEVVVRAGSEPTSASLHQMSFPETRQFWADLGAAEDAATDGPSHPPDERPVLYVKSEFFRRPLPAAAISALLEQFTQGRSPMETRELDFMPWGGAYNRVRPDTTAFVHRAELFQLKHAVVIGTDASPTQKTVAHRVVTRSWATVHPWGSGRVFQNFADPDLEDWAESYYGENVDRLMRIKAQYDPSNFFRFHQSLPAR